MEKKHSFAMLERREVRRLVAEYVVEDMLPLSTVDSPSFIKIVSKIPVQASNDKVSYHCLNRLVLLYPDKRYKKFCLGCMASFCPINRFRLN